MSETIFRLRNLRKEYQRRLVLDISYLEIYRGEILVVVGPNGSGKSTLLRLLNFLEPATSGEIEFMGHSIPPGAPVGLHLRRQVTMVFQQPALLNRSVLANVSYGRKVRGMPAQNGAMTRLLERLGLASLAGSHAPNLSGGERQRVALARALAFQPAVLLLDEPTANLDPYNVSLIEGLIRDLNREQGTTMVLVTHNVFQARRLGHRVAFLLNGQVVEIAPAEQFFTAPQDARTRAFLNGELVW
jgi:tungstate transport system ATP-binding protein